MIARALPEDLHPVIQIGRSVVGWCAYPLIGEFLCSHEALFVQQLQLPFDALPVAVLNLLASYLCSKQL